MWAYGERRRRELNELAHAIHDPAKIKDLYPVQPGKVVRQLRKWWGKDARHS